MTREELNKVCLEEVNKHKCIILNLATGMGKSKLAIDMVNKICDRVYKGSKQETSVLLVVAKQVHKNNWIEEINKWGGLKTDNVTIECYESLKKYRNSHFDVVILDEGHHLSDMRKEILETINIHENIIALSATIDNSLKDWFNSTYNTYILSASLQDAIEDSVLPEPTIYLIPLELKTGLPTEVIIKNPKAKGRILECNWANRWSYIKQKKNPVRIYCNEKQYHEDLCGNIEWLKKRSMHSQIFKNKWLKLCNDRLKWLSDKKTNYIISLLDQLKDERTLTFCNSIEQTEILGKNCIHSKNKNVETIINKFNKGKIDHITACQMVNEGQNLVNCKIGIYANINSSERINIQKFGRLLRHKEPVIIIPFYRNTREEEVLKEILQNFNRDCIKVINNLKEIKL